MNKETMPAQAERKNSLPEADIPKGVTFVNFLCYSVDPTFRRLPESERKQRLKEFLLILQAKRNNLSFRSYLSIGLRHDTDFFFWTIADDLVPFQKFVAEIFGTNFGTYLKPVHTFLAMTRPSVYNPGHIPAFSATKIGGSADSRQEASAGRQSIVAASGGELGEKPRKYLFLYPFVKSREWYLLPLEKRREIMRGHMSVGEHYPMVRLNTTYSFGLGDQDFVLAFETDYPAAFEDLVQRLRESEASRYTVRDTPFILGSFCAGGEELITGLGF